MCLGETSWDFFFFSLIFPVQPKTNSVYNSAIRILLVISEHGNFALELIWIPNHSDWNFYPKRDWSTKTLSFSLELEEIYSKETFIFFFVLFPVWNKMRNDVEEKERRGREKPRTFGRVSFFFCLRGPGGRLYYSDAPSPVASSSSSSLFSSYSYFSQRSHLISIQSARLMSLISVFIIALVILQWFELDLSRLHLNFNQRKGKMEKFHNDSVWSISPANCTEGFNCSDLTDGGLNDLVRNETCTNDYCDTDADYIDRIEAYMFPSVYEWILIGLHCVVFIVGLAGNFLVCLAVYRNHTMRTVTNMFIVNLAIADFLVIFLCLPPTVLWDITETWFMGNTLCKIIPYFQVNRNQ